MKRPRNEIPKGALRGKAKALRRPRGPNKTEAAYAEYLEDLRSAGIVRRFRFQGVRLRLARGALYTPDFLVVTDRGTWEAHEVKGHMREAARVRLLVAAEEWPEIRFLLVRRDRTYFGTWTFEEIQP